MTRACVLAAMITLFSPFGMAQSKSKAAVCVWVESEEPGAVMQGQTGGSILPLPDDAVKRIQGLAVADIRADKSNEVVDPCPQSGENIEIDVVAGQFRGGYVASLSITIQGRKDGPIHVSSNVLGANTEKILASDVSFAYESTKFRISLGLGIK